MLFRTATPERDYVLAATTLMRLGGLGVAFQQRWLELQITAAIHAAREWAHLLESVQRSAEQIIGGALPDALASDAEPLTGRRRTASRRLRSVIINFPDRRTPGD